MRNRHLSIIVFIIFLYVILGVVAGYFFLNGSDSGFIMPTVARTPYIYMTP